MHRLAVLVVASLVGFADEPLSDYGVHDDYRNTVAGDRAYRGKTLTVDVLAIEVARDGDGYVLLGLGAVRGGKLIPASRFAIGKADAAAFADVKPGGAARVVVKAVCAGRIDAAGYFGGYYVAYTDAKFVALVK